METTPNPIIRWRPSQKSVTIREDMNNEGPSAQILVYP